MKKILTIIMGTSLLVGCTPTRSDMQSSIDDMTSQLTQSEKNLEAKEAERLRQVDLLCGLTVETLNLGMLQYVGNDTFMLPDGGLLTIEDMEKQCLDLMDGYEEDVRKRAAYLASKQEATDEEHSE